MSEQEIKQTLSAEASELISRLEKRLERERGARKQAEAIAEQGMRDLFLANRDLDRQVSDRTEELRSEVLKSSEAAEGRLLFLSSLSRQVRTPLNGVSGMLELLANQDLDEQSMIWLKSAQVSSKDLLRLFSRLALYMELSDQDEFIPVSLNMRSMINEVSETWGKQCLSVGQLLITDNQLEDDLSVDISPKLFSELVSELFDNVIRHGEPGPINFHARRNKNSIEITITDNGPGIEDPMNRLQSRSESKVFTQTLGMGYALIGKLSEALNSTVTQVCNGSTKVTVLIPIEGADL